jgi:GNAT superfamily N-acetyltransferase
MAVMAAPGTVVQLRPITDADVPAVARFLHANLNDRVPAESWARAVDVPWDVHRPNAGFMLVDGDREGDAVVGAHLAYYSEREIDGRTERFCDLGAFCVLPGYRFHALRLLKALLAMDGYHFTDLSPSGNVVGLNERLGFRFLDTTTTVMPNVPWPTRPGRDTISSDPAFIERTLTGAQLRHYRDHATAGAARHLLLVRGGDACHVVFRKDRRKGLPVFASILHVSDPQLFRAMARPLARHLLLRHGAVVTLVERCVVELRPRLSLSVDSARVKMFRSRSLDPTHIDYLYSELVCLSW